MEWDEIDGRIGKRVMIVLTPDGEEILKYPPTRGGGDGAYQLNLLGEMERIPTEGIGDDESEAPSDHSDEEHETINPEEQHVMIIRMNFHGAPDTKKHEQRENIFQTKCRVKGEICDVIIDSGSETNCVDRRLVDRLQLETSLHPSPYKLKWLDDHSGQRVRKQCLINLIIGSYHYEIIFDVLNMDACHILLGRPWQHDKKAQHNGYTNVYTIRDKGKKKDLMPLPPNKIVPPPPPEKSANVTLISRK